MSKSEAHEVLGPPSFSPDKEFEWFKQSGVTVIFENDKASKIIVHGPWNRDFITYKDKVIYGIRATDRVSDLLNALGPPVETQEIDVDDRVKIYRWRKDGYFIEVDIWKKESVESGQTWSPGSIRSIELSRAIGGN